MKTPIVIMAATLALTSPALATSGSQDQGLSCSGCGDPDGNNAVEGGMAGAVGGAVVGGLKGAMMTEQPIIPECERFRDELRKTTAELAVCEILQVLMDRFPTETRTVIAEILDEMDRAADHALHPRRN
jgi:hypothetical protein